MAENQLSNWEKNVQSIWDKHASDWKENSKDRWQTGSRKEIVPFLKKYLQPKSVVIDVGCGAGYSTHLLKEAGFESFGVDISREMIRHAKHTYQNLSFSVADMSQMHTIKDEVADGALVINVLEWTETPIKAVNELKRITKPNGYLCVGVLGPTAGPRAHSYRRIYGETVIQNTMMPWEFLQMAYENDFELIDHFFVWRKGVKEQHITSLQFSMQQALSFMTVFMLRKKELNIDDESRRKK